MEKFVASNGIEVQVDGGCVQIFNDNCSPRNTLENYDSLDSDDMDALREFFLHERDQELGRWRWPEYPEYVVYPDSIDKDEVVVMAEHDRATEHVWRGNERAGSYLHDAARAYFAAHPEPKPWHDAKHLEIWALTVRGCPSEAYIYRESPAARRDPGFRPVNHEERVRFTKDDSRITDAHRIWPEVS